MTLADLDQWLIWLLVIVPFVDWASFGIVWWFAHSNPGIESLAERRRVAFAIALGTTIIWPLGLLAAHMLPDVSIPRDVAIAMFAVGLLIPSFVASWLAIAVAVDWWRDRRDR